MGIYIISGVILFVLTLLIFYVAHVYNKLVKGRNRVNTQWAQIDVQLTRRADLIPNLVETVKGYASHEKGIFEKIADAKSAFDRAFSPGQMITANDHLSGQLPSLFAIAEAYPDLKADRNFIKLQSELKETEDKIAYARQFYNDTVLIYRDNIHQFPSSMIAKMFGFKEEGYYIAAEEKKEALKINL